MVIAVLTPEEVVIGCRAALGLPTTPNPKINEPLIAGLLRRSAGFLCPCSRTSLRSALLESLQGLGCQEPELADEIDSVIEGLIVGGDLLELNDVSTSDSEAKGTWVFASTPSFVAREDGSIFLIGIVPDQDTFLPPSLASRVIHERFTRTIEPEPGEILEDELREEGLQLLTERTWLKAPRPDTAENLMVSMERRLQAQPPSGSFEGLQILDSSRPVRYYKGRWIAPTSLHHGNFIGRRPQDYGAPTWCFVSLEHGVPVRLLDLPLKKTRWRACDVAWQLQMAIDHCRSEPQLYRRIAADDRVRFDFFSPLPQWSERRLMIFGRPEPLNGCLISYSLSNNFVDQEERFLQDQLWLARTNDSN